MQTVTVLLSVYKGTNYLIELLDSILSQEGVKVDIFIRDDGSDQETTFKILEDYSGNTNIHCLYEKNLGAGASFVELLRMAPESEFYAFADQDDVWLPGKLRKAVDTLQKVETHDAPLLYFCNYNIIDGKGLIIQHGHERHLKITKQNALFESFAPGCSMVFNKNLLELVRTHLPDQPFIHDRWLFLSALFMGRVFVDDTPLLNYRLHDNNVVGCLTEKEKKSFNRLLTPSSFSSSDYAKMLLSQYSQLLSDDDKVIISRMAVYKDRFSARCHIAFSPAYALAYGGVLRRVYWMLRILLKKV